MREKIMEILEDLRPDVDFETEDKLVSGGILASFDIVSLVTELSDEFGISVGPKHLVADNFDSVDAIVKLMEQLVK